VVSPAQWEVESTRRLVPLPHRQKQAPENDRDMSLDRWVQLVIYAVGVGIAIKVFASAWRHFWNIETGLRESGALAGAIIAILVIWGIERGPRLAGLIAGLIIAGYFLIKLIKKYMG
jgi:hypothetical protein